MSSGRIDVHHHFFPETFEKEKMNTTIGWRTPEGSLPWTPEKSIEAMDALDIRTAIISFPSISAGEISEGNRAAARAHNAFAVGVCKAHLGRFGFFATVPFLDDTEGVLAEISYALDELKADGIALASSYGTASGAAYIGHPKYEAIWAELDKRHAVVFVHGAMTPSSTPFPDDLLGIPITEVPNETYKAAAHLVVTGTKRKYPHVRIILAHLGGSTPFLAPRVAVLSRHMGCALTPEEILEDFKSFYYDTALSAYDSNLQAMDAFVGADRLLFGTDYPAVSTDMARWYADNLVEHYSKDIERLQRVARDNALALFPRLK